MTQSSPKSTDRADALKSVVRLHAEQEFAEELAAVRENDDFPKPENWLTSPKMTKLYLLGGRAPNGMEITPKYVGDPRIIERAIATLATDRALLLYGLPGTAKSKVSEHLAAAISGDSTLLVQGTAGVDESALRYGWNYAQLIANGPSFDALVNSPMSVGMERGKIVRVEELTRILGDVQDALVTILSEKTLPIPQLNDEIQAKNGFNVIATANNRDRGVNELSSALSRRFNTVILPPPATLEEEVEIVRLNVAQMGRALQYPVEKPADKELIRVVTIFRELRAGATLDGKTKIKSPSGTLSAAEAISVVNNGLANAGYFGSGTLTAADLATSLVGAIVKDPGVDAVAWREYRQTVMKDREGWDDLYKACKDIDE